MSEGEKPIFFGGLPPRSDAAAGERRVDVVPSRWRKLLIIGVPVVAVLGLGLVFGPGIAQTIVGTSSAHGDGFVEQPVSPEDQAKAEAAIAEGGGAVAGHIVSAQLCTALDVYVTVSSGSASGTDASPEVLAAMDALAAVDSPYQDAYRHYASWVKAPESISTIKETQRVASAFAKAIQVDTATCA